MAGVTESRVGYFESVLCVIVDDSPLVSGMSHLAAQRAARGVVSPPDLESFAALLTARSWSRVVICGSGPLSARLRAWADRPVAVDFFDDDTSGVDVCKRLERATSEIAAPYWVVVDAQNPGVMLSPLQTQLEAVRAGADFSILEGVPDYQSSLVARRESLGRLSVMWSQARRFQLGAGLWTTLDNVRLAFQVKGVAVEPHGWGSDDPRFHQPWRHQPRTASPPHNRTKLLAIHYTTRVNPGATKAFLTAVEYLARSWEVTAIVPGEGPIRTALERFGIKVVPLPFTPAFIDLENGRAMTRFLRECTTMRNVLQEEQPALVYISNGAPAMSFAATLAGLPTVLHLHVWLEAFAQREAAWRTIERTCLPAHDRIVAAAGWFAEAVKQYLKLGDDRVVSIPCGIDIDRYVQSDMGDVRARFGLDKEAFVISSAGLLLPCKRHELALEALAELRSRAVPAKLLIAGGNEVDPEHGSWLRGRAVELGVDPHVQFIAHLEDVRPLYHASDVFVHCAEGDTYPQVVMEAMCAGRPVIAFRSGGPEEQIEHLRTGILMERDASGIDLGAVLAELACDRPRANALGEAARAHARINFTQERYADELSRLLVQLSQSQASSR